MSVQRVRWHGAGSRGARRRHARRRTQRAQGTPASGRQAPTAPPAGQTAIVPDVAGPARPRKPPCRPACRLRGRHEGEMRQHDPVALSDLPSGRGGGGCTARPAPPWHAAICDTNSMAADVWQNYGPVTFIFRLKQIRRCAGRPCGDGCVHGSYLPAPRAGMACSNAGRVWGVWPVWCPVPSVERGASGVLPGAAGVVPRRNRPARRRPGLHAATGRNRLCLHHGRPRCPAAAPVPGMRCRPFPAPCSGSSL